MKFKFTKRNSHGEDETIIILWAEHAQYCEKCNTVNLEQSSIFARTCAMGAKLLAEEIVKRQAPVEGFNRKKIQDDWVEAGGQIPTRLKNDYTRYVDGTNKEAPAQAIPDEAQTK